jgi:hypothetical protein
MGVVLIPITQRGLACNGRQMLGSNAFGPFWRPKPLTSTKLFGVLQQSFSVPSVPSQATLSTS